MTHTGFLNYYQNDNFMEIFVFIIKNYGIKIQFKIQNA